MKRILEKQWNHCIRSYRSKNSKCLIHELCSNEALDEVAVYPKEYGHLVFIDRYKNSIYADDQKVVVGYGGQNNLKWEGNALAVTIHSTTPSNRKG